MDDGKTISWSQKTYSKEYATFQLPCGKCIECRLEYARSWAVRCVHEAKMYENNSFITLTYDNNHLKSGRLQYSDFQEFIRSIRDERRYQFPHLSKEELAIGFFVTGEYAPDTKRPHWHAILFNWRPSDLLYHYSNERGDKVYKSETLQSHWPNGFAELGSVTFESAGYVARYAAKKLVHGPDAIHDFHPISKKSSRYAIGKKFLEKYWQDIFNTGTIELYGGEQTSIPRYYEKWLKKHQPHAWLRYVTQIKQPKIETAEARKEKEQQEYIALNEKRHSHIAHISPTKVKEILIKEKFKQLQKYLKGDI